MSTCDAGLDFEFGFFNLQLGATSVTESVFRDDAFQKQISEAAESLKKLRAVAIFIENNAVGTGKAPYEVQETPLDPIHFVRICFDRNLVFPYRD